MSLRKKLLENCYFYVIIDKKTIGNRSITDIAKKLRKSGVKLVQLRDKESSRESILENALKLRKILLKDKTIFIINDYLDIAKIIDSDGVHLGQDDVSLELARRILGKDKIIGVSCHSLKQAQDAQDKGADYISIGPIFATPTKPQYQPIGLNLIEKIKDKIKIPIFAIGGINEKNIGRLLSYGIKRVAVCRTVCQAKDITASVRNFSLILGR